MLNARGELVGINFDRTWLSTMSDIAFDPDICRNIAVDIRYVLFVIDRVGGAGYLLDEMKIRKSKRRGSGGRKRKIVILLPEHPKTDPMKQIPSAVRTAILVLAFVGGLRQRGRGRRPGARQDRHSERLLGGGRTNRRVRERRKRTPSPPRPLVRQRRSGGARCSPNRAPKETRRSGSPWRPTPADTARSATVRITAGNFFPASFKVIQGSPTDGPAVNAQERMRRSRATTSGTKPTGRRNATCRSPTPVHTTTSSTIR